MSRFTLTLTADTPAELAASIAAVAMIVAPGPIAAPATPLPPTADTGDDDNDDGPANTAAPDVDSRGIRWDERIHAATKSVNKDGSWRYRRGVDEKLIEEVEQEQRFAIPASLRPQPDPAPTPTPQPQPQVVPTVPNGQPAAAPQPAQAITYESVIELLSQKLQAGTIGPNDLPRFWQDVGIAGAQELPNNPAAQTKAFTLLNLK